MRRYHWPEEQVEVTLRTLGNVIAASLPLTLHQALEAGRLGAGDTALLVGTGAGLIAGGDLGVVEVVWLRFPHPQPPTPGGQGEPALALGRYFAGVCGGCRAGTATPHTPSFALASFAPRASRTTGLVATTVT
ncbi:3-oxoacyl-[acyl-carrier-protein] synthase III C-terminal domain-containing protein [Deinococcus aquaticus]|uniref:3-oxoacyl-[acyl-carrier-protein] synthase III C-terminal domain-containing protein n=1 Tax=Deinococcus aquaticus TaxID=328692 RepID=UPI003618AFAD